jgi:hypothetical protein
MTTIQQLFEHKTENWLQTRNYQKFMDCLKTKHLLETIAIRKFKSNQIVDCSKPCSTCAFTKNAVANLEPQNHLKGLICVLTPSTFYCHHEIDWDNPELPDRMSLSQRKSLGLKVCRGWKREVNNLAKTGYYQEHPEATKAFGVMAMENLTFWLDEKDSDGRNEVWSQFKVLMKKLTDKKKRFVND